MTFDDDTALDHALGADRPVTPPAFRGDLARHLASEGSPPSRPRRLWLAVAVAAGAGAVLLGVAAAGIPA
jgi:hypothetical protein